MYQALYRKWRPLVFSDVIGQGHVTETLRRQVETGRLSHAYLFTGTRGTGKTTCAKILARAVNCRSPENGNPCNKCPVCLGILDASIPDIAEIDAASNSGVDNIRALREESVYTPVFAKKRVYIIDEVHMLSTGAFNALLKTLEEPPAHVMFVLATTETHKVPATILSRCQRFAFRRISEEEIAGRLLAVSEAEGIPLEPAAARLLAALSDGALRDGLSLLDQCAAQSSGFPVDTALVRELVGLVGREQISELAGYAAAGDLAASLAALDSLLRAGKDLSAVLDELSVLMRDALLAHMLPGHGAADAAALRLKDACTKERLIEDILLLQETQTRLPASFNRRLEAELCLIRLCRPGTEPLPAESPPADRRPAAAAPRATAPGAEPARPAPAVRGDGETASPAPSPPPQAPEEKPPAAPPLQPAEGRRPAGERLRKLLGLNEYFKSLIADELAEEDGDTLYLTIRDPFALQMLKQKEFEALVRTVYPGGVDISPEQPGPGAKKRISDFKARLGELLIEE